jgi:DUF1009 family protein
MGQLVTPWRLASCQGPSQSVAEAFPPSQLGIIAGQGRYPFLVAEAARRAGVRRVCVAGLVGETDPALEGFADEFAWIRVGQLGRLVRQLAQWGVSQAIMAGAVRPRNLFELRPDLRALLTLAKLRERNAATIFGAVAEELQKVGVLLLPATTFLEDSLAQEGLMAGPVPRRRFLEDAKIGFRLAKEIARLDIGQSVVVERGVVLAVEAWEGTDEAMRRGGALGKKGAVLVKVAKPNQDLRFDVPVIGERTVAVAAQSGLAGIVCEARVTLLLDLPRVCELAAEKNIVLYGMGSPLDDGG